MKLTLDTAKNVNVGQGQRNNVRDKTSDQYKEMEQNPVIKPLTQQLTGSLRHG